MEEEQFYGKSRGESGLRDAQNQGLQPGSPLPPVSFKASSHQAAGIVAAFE